MMMGVKEIQTATVHETSLANLFAHQSSLEGWRNRRTHRPRARMTSVYFLAFGMILPIVFCQIPGTIIHAAVDAQNPPHSTDSQTDHQS